MGVAIESDFQLAEGSSLHLICVLQLLNPVRLFALKTGNFAFNCHTLLVFFIDTADELRSLRLSLHLLLHVARLKCLFFLVADHLLHGLVFQFFGMFLDLNHFLVLVTLTFDVMRVIQIFIMLLHLLILD